MNANFRHGDHWDRSSRVRSQRPLVPWPVGSINDILLIPCNRLRKALLPRDAGAPAERAQLRLVDEIPERSREVSIGAERRASNFAHRRSLNKRSVTFSMEIAGSSLKCAQISLATCSTVRSEFVPMLYVSPMMPLCTITLNASATSVTYLQQSEDSVKHKCRTPKTLAHRKLRSDDPLPWMGSFAPRLASRVNLGISFSGYWCGPYTLFPRVMMHGSRYEVKYA